MQLSDHRVFPRSSQNLDRKTALRHRKNTPAAPVRGIVSPGPKLAISQIQNFKKEGIVSFPGTPRMSKTNVGSYVNRTREN
jgi:hypothetical protein